MKMAKNNVYITLPNAELGKSDAVFSIYQNEKKLGTITISKELIEWYPFNAKQPYNISWKQFDKMVKAIRFIRLSKIDEQEMKRNQVRVDAGSYNQFEQGYKEND